MKRIFTIAMILSAFVLLMAGCKKDPVEPMVVLDEQSSVASYNKAWVYAEVTDDGGAAATQRGFCFGEAGGELDNEVLVDDDAPFSSELSGLKPSTAYTCRAFAVNEAGRGYSNAFTFTTLNDTIPTVITFGVKEVTYHSVVVSGQVLSGGGHQITDKGICYSLSALPTVDDSCWSAGSGVGPFEAHIEGLLPDIRYYYRAYAVSPEGVFYGFQEVFDTDVLPLAVRTIGVTDVTASRVKAEGHIIRDGGLEILERGFCWGTEHEPTIEGLHEKVGSLEEDYSCYISGLERGQVHYLRAYAANEKEVTYGEEVEFLPDDPFGPWPGGVSPGLFSVSPDRQVRFSMGNLQYNANDDVFRFAEHQWDFVGGEFFDYYYGDYLNAGTVYVDGVRSDNTLISRYYDGWIDLFGWATSGWDNGNLYFKPYDRTAHKYDCAFYGPPGNYDLTGDYAEADWGVHNTISNGGSRQWRTPSAPEFDYLLVERVTPSGIRFAKATVAGVVGLIVLPDDWDASYYPLRRVNVDGTFTANIVSAGEWLDVLEPAGAVFLPAAGSRSQYSGETASHLYYASMNPNECHACYWTVTQGVGVDNASRLGFCGEDGYIYFYHDYQLFYDHADRCVGYSVRLISDE